MFTASVEGADELARTWTRAMAQVDAGVRLAVSVGTTQGAAEARAKHKFKNQSGNLERSIKGRLIGKAGNGYRGEIVATMPYASIVEEGRRAITAGPGKMLRFVIGGAVFYRKSVKAATALPFMGIAYLKCEAVMIREIEIGIAQAQVTLSG